MNNRGRRWQKVVGIVFAACLVGVLAAHAEFGVVNLAARDGKEIVVQPGDEFSVVIPRGRADGPFPLYLGDSDAVITAQPGEKIPVCYDFPGIYTLVAALDGYEELVTTVRVIGTPSDQMFSAASSGSGVSVGSVYAGDGLFVLRIVGAAGTDFELRVYGGGSVFDATLESGETIKVVEGPDDDEDPWTLIKYINGEQKGGTHVLSSGSPYVLKVDDIHLSEAPHSKANDSDLGYDIFGLAEGKSGVVEVVPNPLWALHDECADLYTWSGDGVSGTGLRKTISYAQGGFKGLKVKCTTDPDGAEATAAVIHMDLDGVELVEADDGSTSWITVDDDREDAPGVLLADGGTRLSIQDPLANAGEFKLSWGDPGAGTLQIGGSDSPLYVMVVGPWAKLFSAVGSDWDLEDSATVTMTHSLLADTEKDSVTLKTLIVEIVDPDCGNIGVKDERILTAEVRPEGDYELDWWIVGPNQGAQLQETGFRTAKYKASKKEGTRVVKVAIDGIAACSDTMTMTQVGEFDDNDTELMVFIDPDVMAMEIGRFGYCKFHALRVDDLSVYFKDGTWRLDIFDLIVHIKMGFSYLELTPVLTADDDVVTQDTYQQILDDIDALKATQYESAAASGIEQFVAMSVVYVHENTHKNQLLEIALAGWPAFQEALDELNEPFSCPDVHDEEQAWAALQPKLEALLMETYALWRQQQLALGETAAREAADEFADNLKAEILARAQAEGWE